MSTLPIAIIGGGPVGLAAAAHLTERDESFIVLEAGPTVADNVRQWGHVRIFSPWKYVTDPAAVRLLENTNWQAPDEEGFPTGAEIYDDYLKHLGALLAEHVITNARVTNIDRKTGVNGEHTPFRITYTNADGHDEHILARAVIDASGTYGTPKHLGRGGNDAVGEAEFSDHIFYGIPDILGQHRDRFANKRVAVVGSGASAFNVLNYLEKTPQRSTRNTSRVGVAP